MNRRLQERNEKLIQEKNPSDLKVGLGASPEAIQKQAQRVTSTLPQSPRKWARTVSHIIRNASPRKQTALNITMTERPQSGQKG